MYYFITKDGKLNLSPSREMVMKKSRKNYVVRTPEMLMIHMVNEHPIMKKHLPKYDNLEQARIFSSIIAKEMLKSEEEEYYDNGSESYKDYIGNVPSKFEELRKKKSAKPKQKRKTCGCKK